MKLQDPFKGTLMDVAEHVLDTIFDKHWLIRDATQIRKSISAVNELGSFLIVKFVMLKEDLPQFIFHYS
jgi:hypothetical protein